jgi:hypothetical protein
VGHGTQKRKLEYYDEDDGPISEPIVTWDELQREAVEAEASPA